MTALTAAFPALRHRNYRIFVLGQFVSLCGTWMQQVALGWLVLELAGSPYTVGLVSAVGSLPILLFTLLGGVVADRGNRLRIVIAMQALMLVEALTLATLVGTGRITIPALMALAAFLGLLTAFEVPARQALLGELVPRHDLMNAIAINSTGFNVARVIGPAIAGFLIATLGVAACFYANAASYVAVLVGLRAVRLPPERTHRATTSLARSLREGFAYVFGTPRPRRMVLVQAAMTVFGYSFVSQLPTFTRDVLRSDAAGYGTEVAAVGVGAAVAAIVLALLSARVRQGRSALVAATAFGILLMLASRAPDIWSAAAVLTLTGAAMATTGISTNTMLQHEAPEALRGRVMGFYSFVVLGMAPFGAYWMGWTAERFGVRAAFLAGGAACAAAALLGALAMMRAARLEVRSQKSSMT